ncbi:uncharacterized protein N7483_010127 [Penicillium malachiteum]|uniref:uncharacterized protein n=1 Tax=Penicillium malachiteum TaxID=1324776 RepID=UPI00254826BA|nr:uncharacterized protein N7483_010127 [Penicillium malachiteum]KAJ5712946.1 hypothetical protein N7483_010127 [Penicillium malachiteum]
MVNPTAARSSSQTHFPSTFSSTYYVDVMELSSSPADIESYATFWTDLKLSQAHRLWGYVAICPSSRFCIALSLRALFLRLVKTLEFMRPRPRYLVSIEEQQSPIGHL